ncbi:hypothetical protein HYV89_02330 [Candidatus Woesearchaeota archaeon]|nr:hypothetical protein [Candidatus Woesearchaeota archaeon]
MNKKLFYAIIIVSIIAVIGFGYNILRYSLDPFGAPPKGTSPNCGPEDRYKFEVTINSKEDFVNFFKSSEGKLLDQYGNKWVKFDNFRDSPQSEVNWNKVLSEVKTKNTGIKTIYVLKYNPFTCSGFTLKMTSDGHVSVYGCCGI